MYFCVVKEHSSDIVGIKDIKHWRKEALQWMTNYSYLTKKHFHRCRQLLVPYLDAGPAVDKCGRVSSSRDFLLSLFLCLAPFLLLDGTSGDKVGQEGEDPSSTSSFPQFLSSYFGKE